jgi:hypothetical protein
MGPPERMTIRWTAQGEVKYVMYVMNDSIAAVFPDRETADHALRQLQDAGFEPYRTNAEDFERPEYYLHQMSQGTTLISVETGARAAEAQAILDRLGGTNVRSVTSGNAPLPTALTGEKVDPDAAVEERVALERKA